MNEKQIEQMKEIILTLKEKNDNLTIELDDIATQNYELLKDKNSLLHKTKELENQNLNLSKQRVQNIIYDKKGNLKNKKKNTIFNIVFAIIVFIFILIEIYIFIL